MELSYTVYMVVHGFCFGVMFMLAIYLLTSERSAYSHDVEPNMLVRRNAGFNLLLWSFTFGVRLLDLVFRDTPYIRTFPNLDTMMCLLVVPGIASFLLCLLQLQKTLYHYFWLHVLTPICLIIWYLFDPQPICLFLSIGYWVIYVICFAVWFIRLEHRYRRRLEDIYSTFDHHDIRWIYNFLWLFLVYFVLFLVSHVLDSMPALYFTYAYCLVLWTRLVYYADSYENIPSFWTSEPDKLASSEPEKIAISKFDWVGDRLHEECEEKELYLRHDLNVDTLASHLGTNRTYIGRYFSSKGLTYFTYINTLRINHVKRLMAENPDESLSSIAFQSGFKSESTFRRAFLDIEQCTPSEYIKRVK